MEVFGLSKRIEDSRRKLTKGEAEFHATWQNVVVVETFSDVLEVVEGMA